MATRRIETQSPPRDDAEATYPVRSRRRGISRDGDRLNGLRRHEGQVIRRNEVRARADARRGGRCGVLNHTFYPPATLTQMTMSPSTGAMTRNYNVVCHG